MFARFHRCLCALALLLQPAIGVCGESDAIPGDAAASEAAATGNWLEADPARWDHYLRGFRQDHNFGVLIGSSHGRWNVSRLGTIRDRSFSDRGLYMHFWYSFQIPIYRGFGYLLGTGFGYVLTTPSGGSPFKTVPGYSFPGGTAGLVYNFNPRWRTSVSLSGYVERFDGLRERDRVEPDVSASFTAQVVDMDWALDWFYRFNWAVRIEHHRRHIKFARPLDVESGAALDAKLVKQDEWWGAGMVFHLL